MYFININFINIYKVFVDNNKYIIFIFKKYMLFYGGFMENQNLNILDEINKGATMGMDAISYISDKVSDYDFKEVLNTEYNKYKKNFKKSKWLIL